VFDMPFSHRETVLYQKRSMIIDVKVPYMFTISTDNTLALQRSRFTLFSRSLGFMLLKIPSSKELKSV
jgi:hypothetical protein